MINKTTKQVVKEVTEIVGETFVCDVCKREGQYKKYLNDWGMYSDKLWKNAYERGQADAYEKAKPNVTVSVKVGNETVETIEINGDAVRWSSSSL